MAAAESFYFPIERLEVISQIVVDSSSVILAHQSGFLETFLDTLHAHAPPAVLVELREGAAGHQDADRYNAITVDSFPGPGPADAQVLDLAERLRLPLASDDFRLLAEATDRGLDAYPSLAILEILLLKGSLTPGEYDRCRMKLADLIHYPDPVFRACVDLHNQVRKFTG